MRLNVANAGLLRTEVEHRAAFADADQVWVNAGCAETRIVRGDDDILPGQHRRQALIMPATSGIKEGAHFSTTPEVGCAQAMTFRPPAGGLPGGMKMAPDTSIGWPFKPVDW
ncbi:MAG: hypothetical protein R3D30_12260 [Hyphomicrobiales bacterium]